MTILSHVSFEAGPQARAGRGTTGEPEGEPAAPVKARRACAAAESRRKTEIFAW
ncbi:MAG: hypothetical protein K9L75_03585 [Spirochaetia bacterium]|nr:hypothetical protein [Spirochaetia bacterium]